MKHITIIRGSMIGEVVVVLPFLKNLRKLYPQSHITYISSSGWGLQLLKATGLVDKIISYTPGSYKNLLLFIQQILSTKHDLIFNTDLSYKFKHFFIHLCCRFPIRKQRKEASPLISIIDQLNDVLDGVNIEMEKSLLFPVNLNKETNHINNILHELSVNNKKNIIIHLGGMERSIINGLNPRCRAIENRAIVLEWIVNHTNYSIIFIGGKDNIEHTDLLLRSLNSSKIHSLVNKLSILETMALIKESALLLCTDSGPMHLGIMMDTKTLALLSHITWNIDDYLTYKIRRSQMNDIKPLEVINLLSSIL